MWNYLMSILIFYVIINSSVKIAKVFLDGKGRLEKIERFNEENKGLSVSTFIICCVPVFRLIVVMTIFYICFCSNKEFNRIFKDKKSSN